MKFEDYLAFARSESIKRIRDNGADIFEDLKDKINAGFTQLRAQNAEPLTYRLPKQDPVTLDGFGNSLFLHESAGARRFLPGVDDMVGIWEDDSGNFDSSPLDAQLIYKDYEVVAGDEFQSELLFRVSAIIASGLS